MSCFPLDEHFAILEEKKHLKHEVIQEGSQCEALLQL